MSHVTFVTSTNKFRAVFVVSVTVPGDIWDMLIVKNGGLS